MSIQIAVSIYKIKIFANNIIFVNLVSIIQLHTISTIFYYFMLIQYYPVLLYDIFL